MCTHPKTGTVVNEHAFISMGAPTPPKADGVSKELDDGSTLMVDKATRDKYPYGCSVCARRLNINKRLFCKETGAGKCRHPECEAKAGKKRESEDGGSQASGPNYKRSRDDPKKLPAISKLGAMRIVRGTLSNEEAQLGEMEEELEKQQKAVEKQQKAVDKLKQALAYMAGEQEVAQEEGEEAAKEEE